MWNKKLLIGLLTVSASMAGASLADEAKDQASVARLLPSAKVTLSQGLAVSESKGQPISGKFEVDEGHFQLSIYTAQGAALQEQHHAVAMVTLVKGTQFKSVSEPLE